MGAKDKNYMKKLFENTKGNSFKLLNETSWDVKDFNTSGQIEKEEDREVQIGKQIIGRIETLRTDPNPNRITQMTFEIENLAKELLKIHGVNV